MKKMPEQARQSRVSLSKVARQEPRNSYCYEEGKLALASVGATKQVQKWNAVSSSNSSGEDWNSSGDLVTTEDTIKVVEGENQ